MTTIDIIRANEKQSKINYLKNTILWHSDDIKDLCTKKSKLEDNFKIKEKRSDTWLIDWYKIRLAITLKEKSLQILEEEFKTILKTIK